MAEPNHQAPNSTDPPLDCNLFVAISLANRAVQLGIRFIAFHNEQSAGYAASAYGYLTGRPGVLLTVSGPGCVHGLAGLSNAGANTWPLVMISGSCDQRDFGCGDFQELDQMAAVKPFSKFSVKATDIKLIPKSIFDVLHHAGSGRPGGCYLDIPSDVLHQSIPESEAEKLLAEAESSRKQEIIEKAEVPPVVLWVSVHLALPEPNQQNQNKLVHDPLR